jgi:hypothetical protein
MFRILFVKHLILAIKRRETWWDRWLHAQAVPIRKIHTPYCLPIHMPSYDEKHACLRIWSDFKCPIYYVALSKVWCVSVVRGLQILQQVPLIAGISQSFIGDYVMIDETNAFAAK